ncbi:MAG: 30S ribosomal protein S2 [Lentisphaerae bacterium RIFOXYB12_FULL_65_16]|nr:MAG: 30S ribosomal protein S2 [Lentisphaerae bacterium RIFOXYA12_64_32]OGV88126.1 MAG: 30S ribosomal protein S2 [Lentisphaerae bacterium RIFOXYB12_FULL_65_16]
MATIAITDLLEAGVHFGHQTKRWNPKMKPYIYGARNGINIFDLTITMRQLAEACSFLTKTVAGGGSVLFVGSKRQAQEVVREAAERTGMFFMCDRWLGGVLTNHQVITTRIQYMKKLREITAEGSTEKLTKKEMAKLRRILEKLERTLGGIAEMGRLPSIMVVVDTGREAIAVREANRLDIPVVGIVDSNSDPELIEYVVPGNDDALRAIKVVIDTLAAAIEEGRQSRSKDRNEPVPAARKTNAKADAAPVEAVAAATVEAPAPVELSADEVEKAAAVQ